ncbi:MAG TPA: hypothetical protein VJY62_08740 [Bacteroidia bacterium]|nr:hypothetical protein [Bacteroidia bacterium]
MAINKNHEFEDLDGVKCAIVEKNVSPDRVEFLKKLLEYNHYTVVVVKSPPPKVVAAKPAPPVTAETPAAPAPPEPAPPPGPETFTVGVTDVVFNATNAIFGRLLHTPDGHVVTLAYWEQEEKIARDDIPYFGEV